MPKPPGLRFAGCFTLLALFCASRPLSAQQRPIVLKASTALDGRGKVLHNSIIVVEGDKIARIGGATPQGDRKSTRLNSSH